MALLKSILLLSLLGAIQAVTIKEDVQGCPPAYYTKKLQDARNNCPRPQGFKNTTLTRKAKEFDCEVEELGLTVNDVIIKQSDVDKFAQDLSNNEKDKAFLLAVFTAVLINVPVTLSIAQQLIYFYIVMQTAVTLACLKRDPLALQCAEGNHLLHKYHCLPNTLSRNPGHDECLAEVRQMPEWKVLQPGGYQSKQQCGEYKDAAAFVFYCRMEKINVVNGTHVNHAILKTAIAARKAPDGLKNLPELCPQELWEAFLKCFLEKALAQCINGRALATAVNFRASPVPPVGRR